MINKLREIRKKTFVRNLIILASGTVAAQVITMAFSPIITRIYGPEAFGVLGVFMAMVGIISPIAALTYPIAIVLPKSDADAKVLVRLSLYVAGIIATITVIVLSLFKNDIVQLLSIQSIAPYLYLIPLVILFSAFLQVAQQWLIRTKQFRITAKAALLNALLINSAKAGIGWFHPVATVLVILSTVGNIFHALMLVIGISHTQRKKEIELDKPASIKILAKQHRDFPLYRAPQVFVNAISQSLPVIMLSIFFGPAAAGFYNIGRTVLNLPIGLLGKSVGDVMYPRIVEAKNNGENIKKLITKSTLALAAVGILPFGSVVVFGPVLFGLVFGEEWTTAGEYASWLALWLFFMFINRPSVVAIPVLGLQRGFLIFEILSILPKLIGILIGYYLFNNDVLAVALYSITGALGYIYLILWVIKSSKRLNIL